MHYQVECVLQNLSNYLPICKKNTTLDIKDFFANEIVQKLNTKTVAPFRISWTGLLALSKAKSMKGQQKQSLNFQLNIRLTDREGEALKQAADASGQTQTQLVRSVMRPILQTVIAAQAVMLPADQSKEKKEV